MNSLSPGQLRRIEHLFEQRYQAIARRTDHLLGLLMIAQWLVGITFALWLSPTAWAGRAQSVHVHVYAAVLLGGLITSLPLILIVMRPGQRTTRYTVAVAQLLWSGLLIHLTGGRIETHFHVFGSLAILAFYRDWTVLVPATIVTVIDHVLRGLFWPESVYGLASSEGWRFLEHAAWVVFIDVFLIINCAESRQELWASSRQQVEIEDAQDRVVRVERLAAVGELAASVGHELRNPLAAVANAHTFIKRRMEKDGIVVSSKVTEFFNLMEAELASCSKIISGLLDFARAREPKRTPTPLRSLADEAVGLIPDPPSSVRVVNEVPEELPALDLDREQFRQVLANLVQNAVEAMPDGYDGEVLVTASAGGPDLLTLQVIDNGPGIELEVREKIFQPLFSTKTKGTGLGLAIVSGIVERHGGKISVDSIVGEGTTFTVELRVPARFSASTLSPP